MFKHNIAGAGAGADAGDDFADGKDGGDGDGEGAGDGLHHHELHEDEAGGFHSKHTHPDGRVETGEHATYDEAADHQAACFGQEGSERNEDEGRDDGGDMSTDDIAGSYGRAGSRD